MIRIVTPQNIEQLINQGQTDIDGEVSIIALRSVATALGCDETDVRVVAGPCETLRIKVPTAPQRNAPMGANIDPG